MADVKWEQWKLRLSFPTPTSLQSASGKFRLRIYTEEFMLPSIGPQESPRPLKWNLLSHQDEVIGFLLTYVTQVPQQTKHRFLCAAVFIMAAGFLDVIFLKVKFSSPGTFSDMKLVRTNLDISLYSCISQFPGSIRKLDKEKKQYTINN